MEPVRAFLIDSNKLFREGLKRLLDDSPFQIAAEAGNLREALNSVENGLRPQLILLDLVNGGEEEADGMRRLRAQLPEARMVILTSDLCTRRLANALEAGADGYLMKDLSSDALAQSLRLVMMGEKVFPTHLAALLISGRVNGNGTDMPVSRKGLSQREVQILRCLLNGDSNKMIANHLNITEATVKVHLKSLLRKINASNRTQAAIWALNNGIGGELAGAGAVTAAAAHQ
ncbi:DNA-binding response regulator [Azospirillum brasilense]|jgi:two-component system nitrate/nitrite response regulator NarL|uniref:DNA-binding response regulator n=2 Tax=Azospirillum TaxID=191 RepID=A0A0P0F6D6_AZOBR|nr:MULTISPECIES: response regulator transcription factor [Azospirillum]ALJ35380.1 two-component system response regulator [Azospirillum brasilense]MDW7556874.1 response regulator transcription factor [Azospirillum brasilense]MDW7596643.1 response regulator transcription factor [Azospirillum brasilense]MDW7631524.1 response regulator transcription factor [Azospirillum brasilense]MDX5954092.1 response regulator transcription factor [Azospirillum brasilense]